jgi:hypothetical protein
MSTENIAPVQSATTTATDRTSETGKSKAQQRAELASLAAEFESMLLMNMLRDMRTSGRWSTGGESGGESLAPTPLIRPSTRSCRATSPRRAGSACRSS